METALSQTPRSGTKPHLLVAGEPGRTSIPFLSSIARSSGRVGWDHGSPFAPGVPIGRAPPRLGAPFRVGHDHITAFICKVESFIGRCKRAAQASFAKRVTMIFVGLRLGMGPGHRSSFSSSSPFCQIKRHSPLSKYMNAHTNTLRDACTQSVLNGSKTRSGGFDFFSF